MSAYDQCFTIVVGEEGGLSMDRNDPGNWTGGAVGSGELKGTQWGISAASFPNVDIANLTQDQAKAIYRPNYWDKLRCDDLPPALALLAFDAAVNNGTGRSAAWLQAVAGAAQDGEVGDKTVAAVTATAARIGGAQLCANYMARRLAFMSLLPTWRIYGANPVTGLPEGWATRLCALPYLSTTITA